MKEFVHLVANYRSLQPSSFLLLGGFIIFSLLGYFANNNSGKNYLDSSKKHSIQSSTEQGDIELAGWSFYSQDLNILLGGFDELISEPGKESATSLLLLDCINVTNGGTISGNQVGCSGFDPEIINSETPASGGAGTLEYIWLSSTNCSLPVLEWPVIPGANQASYNPGPLSTTTCFVRFSKREECTDYVGESNIITIEVVQGCGNHVEDWDYICDEGKIVEIVGIGIKNDVPAILDFDNPENIDQVYVEVIYKGNNPGQTITIFDALGVPYLALRERPGGNSSNVYVYRTGLPSTSSVSYQNQVSENNAQSLVAYVFRNVSQGANCTGQFSYLSGYHTTQTLTFDIATDVEPRDIEVAIPVSEMTEDCRILNITVTAGSVSETVTIDGPGGVGCCLNKVPVLLQNVDADATTVTIEIESPTGSASGCPSTPNHNGQSFVMAGAVKIDVECIDCENVTDGGSISGNESSCEAFNATTIQNTEFPGGGSGAFEFQWQQSYDSENGPWSDIAGAIEAEYDPAYESQTVWYRRIARRDGCSFYLGFSNVVVKVVDEDCSCNLFCPGDVILDCNGSTDPENTGYATILCGNGSANNCDRPEGENILSNELFNDTNTSYSLDQGWNIGSGCNPVCGDGSTVNAFIDFTQFYYNYSRSITSPVLDACCIDAVSIDYCLRQDLFTNGNAPVQHLDIEVSINGGAWNSFASHQTINGETIDYLENNVHIPGAAGNNFRIRFRVHGPGGDFTLGGWGLDNVKIYGNSSGCNIDAPENYTVSYLDDIQNTGCGAGQVIIRDWTATRFTGETYHCTQTITIQDNLAPDVISAPQDLTVECSEIPDAIPPVFSDVCDNDLDIVFDEQLNPGTCGDAAKITRTWTVTDDCDNQRIVQQILTVEDNILPTFSFAPDDITVSCDGTIPVLELPVATDNCDGNVEVVLEEEINNQTNDNSCTDNTYTIFRIFKATDNCGNIAQYSQEILVQDISNPELSGVPDDITVECNEVPVPANPTATDNCGDSVEVSFFEIADNTSNGTCTDHNYSITRTWIAIDNCGNSITQTQTITVENTSNPVMSGVPGNINVSCNSIPDPASPTATDLCDNFVEIDFSQTSTQTFTDECSDNNYIITRTWVARDDCGNEAVQSQTISVEDTSNPILSNLPSDITLFTLPVPEPVAPIATDECDGNVSITFEEISGSGCSYTINRTWTATDNCGNQDFYTQTVFVEHHPESGDLTINDPLVCLAPAGNGQVSATFNGNGLVPQGFAVTYILTRGNNSVIEQINNTPEFFVTQADEYKIHRLVYVADANDYNYLDLNTIQPGLTEASEIISLLEQGGGAICASLSLGVAAKVDACNAKMGDQVFEDLNGNGIRENDEPGIQNVEVILTGLADDNTDVFLTTETDSEGKYIFDNLPPGNYKITFVALADYLITANNIGSDDAFDSDADPVNGMTATEDLDSGEENLTYDAGFYLVTTIGDYAWIDCDKDGVQDDGEDPLAFVPVNLTGENSLGFPVDLNTSTDIDGFYIFENLKPGKYKLTFGFPTQPTGLAYSPQDQTSDDLDSDVDPDNGMTIEYTIQSGDNNLDVDAGFMDVSEPILIGAPTDVIVECDAIPSPPAIGTDITATDNLDTNVEITFSESTTQGPDNDCSNQNYIITRTWTAVDDCGNEKIETQIITVEDTTAPEISGVPSDITVECDAIPNAAQPIATDNCDIDVELNYSENQSGANCADGYTLTRIWTAVDDCGNEKTETQIITVEDTTAPEISGVPSDITVECDAIPNAVQPTATDNCDIEVELNFSENQSGSNCADGYTLTRTWTAVDDCGNEKTETQVITVEDSTDPEISGVPSDITVECNAIPNAAQPTATDNCDVDVELDFSENQSGSNCADGYILTRTWTAVDNCGNEKTETQIITVEDTTAPEISGVPSDLTVECDAIPNAAQPTATDNCDIEVELNYSENQSGTNCADGYTLTRIWTAVDDCGNEKTETQIITVEDTTAPEISGVPSDLTVECDAIPNAAQPTATDNCDIEVELNFSENQSGSNCADGYTLTRTWTAVDDCGNEKTETQVITVEDTTEPEISGIPSDITVECGAIPNAAQPTATDNCDSNVVLTFDEVQNGGNCADNYTLTRIWTAVDNCGNETVETQIISVQDTQEPNLSGVPSDISVSCNQVPTAAQPTATDNCDPNVEILFSEIRTDGDCIDSYVLIRTWTAVDDCGNEASQSQIITVEDTEGPVISGVPNDEIVECDAIPVPAQPTATDDCDADVEITFEEITINGNCTSSYTLTRTWTAIDNCGNETSVSQIITIEDTTDPVLSGVPSDVVVECGAVPAPAQPTATDNCDVNVEITFSEIETDFDCLDSYTIIRTWTATDDCGNSVEAIQLLTVKDTQAPTLSGVPSNVSVSCNQIPAPPHPTATDNCDTNVQILFSEVQSGGTCTDSYFIIRTWTAIDNCGNETSQMQTITVEDNDDPFLSGIPTDVTVECDQIPSPANPIGTDDCDTNVEVTFLETRTDGNCIDSYSLTRTWTAVDNCGNTAEGVQVITVEDNTDPVLSGVPANQTVTCNQVPPPAQPTASDNCDTNVEIIFEEVISNGNCIDIYTITRIWTAIDNCGNEAISTQVISVSDNEDPVLSGVPADITVACDDIPASVNPVATDDCDFDVEIAFDEVQLNGLCENSYRLVRTWTATDNCGNESTGIQTVTVIDETDPVLSGVPSDITVACDEVPAPPATGLITATDNCDVDVEIIFEESSVSGDCASSTIITRSWTAIDNCGNSVTLSQEIIVDDTSAPTISGVPADISVDCNAIPSPASPTASDDCDANIVLDFTELIIDGNCSDSYLIKRTWTAVDNCGNNISASQTITVSDTQEPVLSGVPADIIVDCADIPPAPNTSALVATDNCDADVEIFYAELAMPGACTNSYTITRTWTAIDNCGNETSQSQMVTVEDNSGPTLSGIASDITVECGNIPDPDDVVASDDCDANVQIDLNEVQLDGACEDTYTLVRTWTATDNCGNATQAEQIVTVEDNIAPVLIGVPSNLNVDLSAGEVIPDPASVIGTDNCDTNVEIEFDEIIFNNSCQTIITRTWTAYDNCGNSSSQNQIITASAILSVSISPVSDSICEAGTTTFIVSVQDTSYTYIWSVDGGDLSDVNSPNPIYTGTQAGTFTVTLTVSNGTGCTGTVSTSITVMEQPNASAESNSPVCEGETLELYATSGTSYQWFGPNGFTSEDQNPVIENASSQNSGSYTVIVYSGDCGVPASIEVEVNDEILVDYNAGDSNCDNSGFISLGVFGGTGNYSFNWADLPGTNNPQDRTDLAGGTYSVVVSDAGGCVFVIDAIIILDNNCTCDVLSGATIPSSTTVCLENGNATLSGTADGNAVIPTGFSLIYLLSNPSTGEILNINTSPDFTVSSTGLYAMHAFVYDSLSFDINNIQIGLTTVFDVFLNLEQGGGTICGYLEVSGTPITVTGFVAEVEFTTPDQCNACDGTATLSPSGLIYTWSDGFVGSLRENLCEGTYEVVAMDLTTGCSDDLTVIIGGDCGCTPPEVINTTVENTNCGESNGAISIELAGGNAGYEFDWFPNIGTPDVDGSSRTDLSYGVFIITITDLANIDCFTELTVIVQNIDGPQLDDIVISPASCMEADGSVQLLPEDFIYTWLFDQTQANSRNDLAAGTYEIFVFDLQNASCPNVISVEVGEDCSSNCEPPVVDNIITIESTCGNNNGQATIMVNGNNNDFNYTWSPNVSDTESATNLGAGTYEVTISDAGDSTCFYHCNFCGRKCRWAEY